MGSLRRGLILTLIPSAGSAGVCADVRPQWTPGTPATAWSEILALFGTAPSLVLLVATVAALRFRHQWGGLIVVVLWTVWVSIIAMLSPRDAVQQAAALEGCVATPVLFIAAVAAICIGTVLYTSPRNTRL